MSKTEKAIQWMEETADSAKHGYDQRYRWGEKGDYDCSSAVITAWENAGVPVKTMGATYTGNMYRVFIQAGFKDVTATCNLNNGDGMKRGDVLLNDANHTAMFCGNYRLVQASINEKGTVIGGVPGDQTGREFWIRSYYNYPWTHILRYGETDTTTKKGKSGTALPTGISKTPKFTGTVTADVLNVRTWAGTEYDNIKSYSTLNEGDRVELCSRIHDSKGRAWYYIRIKKKYYGFVCAEYIRID